MTKAIKARLDRLDEPENFTVVIAPEGIEPEDHHRDEWGSDPRVIVLPHGADKL